MANVEPIELVYSLIGYPHETEWLEFKTGNNDPERIGQDISALANSAAWLGRDVAYKIWGVDDGSHELIGTTFNPFAAKAKGNQDLLVWLKLMLTPNANYEFRQFNHDGLHFVVLSIKAACDQPVCFKRMAYVREGSSTTLLAPGSAREVELWRRLQRSDFEERVALENVSFAELSELLDVNAYYKLLNLRVPVSEEGAFESLMEQDLIRRQDNGYYAISNLGALLIARNMEDFSGLSKRPIRILRFAGKGSREILDDTTFTDGYALSLQKAEAYIMSLIPATEEAEGAFRRLRYAYPQRAVRELLANMTIHQDLAVARQGPLVCIYQNRIEFSNPGMSLIRPERVLNAQPKTRNNKLAGILRQMDLCEEGGTGWDLAVASCEDYHMLPPKMETDEELGTSVTLFAGNGFSRMSKNERLNALYWHACLCYADGEAMSNQSLRERFGLDDGQKNSLAMSRLIREACDAGLIKVEDKDAGTKNRRYIPGWA